MFIERMLVERFRHLRDVQLGPFRKPAQIGELIVLAGPNGSGKSSLLELLSLGIATRYNYQYYQARQISNHAFGIKIALADSELAELEAQSPDEAVLEYARRNRGYWVHVNLPSVFGPNEQAVNDRVHAAASREFASFVRRLGFFIRSDRSYGARSYRRDHLFNWKNREQPNYLGNTSYSATNAQYEDMYDYLVEQSYHYVYELGLHTRGGWRSQGWVVRPVPGGKTTSDNPFYVAYDRNQGESNGYVDQSYKSGSFWRWSDAPAHRWDNHGSARRKPALVAPDAGQVRKLHQRLLVPSRKHGQ